MFHVMTEIRSANGLAVQGSAMRSDVTIQQGTPATVRVLCAAFPSVHSVLHPNSTVGSPARIRGLQTGIAGSQRSSASGLGTGERWLRGGADAAADGADSADHLQQAYFATAPRLTGAPRACLRSGPA